MQLSFVTVADSFIATSSPITTDYLSSDTESNQIVNGLDLTTVGINFVLT